METRWERAIGWFIDNRLIVFILTALIIGAGIYVSPFDWKVGELPRDPVPVDAIPDIGENQQIVFTTWPGRSPRDMEDQVTYPLTTSLLGLPGVRTIRSSSAFGFSTIYVIFEDDVEFYWSRSRVLEKLASIPPGTIPDGVVPTLGPDATALGQIFWYTLQGHDDTGELVGGWDQHELRSIQDWMVRYSLQSVKGVAEVASVGGFVQEYQVDVDPEAMRAHQVTLPQVAKAIKDANLDVGARTVEINRIEYMIRGLGFIKGTEDLEKAVVALRDHTPIRVADVARVTIGPQLRRGALDNAGAPAVGGVVVARFGENPLEVIKGVKERIEQIGPGLPKRTLDNGTVSQVTIVPFYDRTVLIQETLETLSTALFEEILITIIVVLVMLRNLRSSLLISSMLPLGVLGAFIFMKYTGVDANIMALGGIAIAIGTMVDISIIFVENTAQHLDRAPPDADRAKLIRRATAEVAPAVLTSVLTTLVSFLPVFGLTESEARLFNPLAYTRSFTMVAALLLGVLVLPGLSHWVLRRRPTQPELSGPIWLRVLRGAIRPIHLRDWFLLAAGLLLIRTHWAAGLMVVLMGLFRFARPYLHQRLITGFTYLENGAAIVAAALLLTADWLPLGPAQGLWINLLFVAGFIVALLGTFKLFEFVYPTLLTYFLRHKLLFFTGPAILVTLGLSTWLGFGSLFGWLPESVRNSEKFTALAQAFPGLGREYMPPFDEGSYLLMPTTMPHASFGQALEMLQEMDARIAQIPEVDQVVGKIGRVESALDPAPVSMFENVITYHPEYRTDDQGNRVRQWRSHIQNAGDIWDEITKAAELPGVTGAPMLMPINARIVMLQSGMRAPMGIKVQGPTLEAIQDFGLKLEEVLREVPAVRKETVFADRVVGKPYIEIDIDRDAIARHGLSVVQVQQVLQVALGGMTLSRSVEGRERYPIRVRYMREERDNLPAISRIAIPMKGGQQIPLSQVAKIVYVRGPQMIKSEDTFLTSYVLFDKQKHVAEVDAVEQADAAIKGAIDSGKLVLPEGVRYRFAGSYENQIRSENRLMILIPIALALVFVLLYFQFHRALESAVIYTGVLVAVAGGFLLIWLYGQPWFLDVEVLGTNMRDLFQVRNVNLSVAVWIGFIALVGIATDDGVVISTYLNQRFKQHKPTTVQQVREQTLEAGRRRVRPCLMTTATTILALLPVITSAGRGSDVMVPMALPSIGGMAIELITLFIVPVLFCTIEELKLRFRGVKPTARENSKP